MDYRNLRDRLTEFGADYESQIVGLQDLISRCQDGIDTQVNTARGDILDITQKRPEIEMQARRLLWDMAKEIYNKAEDVPESSKEVPKLVVEIFDAFPEAQTGVDTGS